MLCRFLYISLRGPNIKNLYIVKTGGVKEERSYTVTLRQGDVKVCIIRQKASQEKWNNKTQKAEKLAYRIW